MAVKVAVHGGNKGQNYPCLMADPESGLIIFMEQATCGMVLQGGTTRYYPGYYGTNWTMNKLVRFAGRITMENE